MRYKCSNSYYTQTALFTLLFSSVPRNFVGGEGQQIHLRTEDRENGDLGAVAP